MTAPDAFAPPGADPTAPMADDVAAMARAATTARIRASLGVGGFGAQLGLLSAVAALSAAGSAPDVFQGTLTLAVALGIGAICCTVFAWQGLRGARVLAALQREQGPTTWHRLLDADRRFWQAATVAGAVLACLPVAMMLWLVAVDLW